MKCYLNARKYRHYRSILVLPWVLLAGMIGCGGQENEILGETDISEVSSTISPADFPYGPNFIRNWATGRCLDGNHAGDLYTSPCQFGNYYQQWAYSVFRAGTPPIYAFRNTQTLRCITGSRTSPCSRITEQDVQRTGTKYKFRMIKRNKNVCVDSNAQGQVYLLPCQAGNDYQSWRFRY